MKNLKVGKKYITRDGCYVFVVGATNILARCYSTTCVKILKKPAESAVTFVIDEVTSHYEEGNWLLSGSEKSCDLVGRYREAKAVHEPGTDEGDWVRAKLGDGVVKMEMNTALAKGLLGICEHFAEKNPGSKGKLGTVGRALKKVFENDRQDS